MIVRWGDYHPQTPLESAAEAEGDGQTKNSATPPLAWPWKRTDQEREVKLALTAGCQARRGEVPDSNGLSRPVRPARPRPARRSRAWCRETRVRLRLPGQSPQPGTGRHCATRRFIFQAALKSHADRPLVPRPNLRGLDTDDWDERVADLQYRDVFEFAVGHGIATDAELDAMVHCRTVRTCWIPGAEVERVAPATIEGVELRWRPWPSWPTAPSAQRSSSALVDSVPRLDRGRRANGPPSRRMPQGDGGRAAQPRRVAAKRIEEGIELLDDRQVLDAFRIANRSWRAARRRFGLMQGKASRVEVQPRRGGRSSSPSC